MSFSIHTGTKSRPDLTTRVVMPFPIFTVVEKRGKKVVECRDFDELAEAQDYIQRAQMIDRDFAMEGR